jgi:hypothetical protein
MAMHIPQGWDQVEKIKKRGLGGGREHCVSKRGHKDFIRLPAANQFDQFERDFVSGTKCGTNGAGSNVSIRRGQKKAG